MNRLPDKVWSMKKGDPMTKEDKSNVLVPQPAPDQPVQPQQTVQTTLIPLPPAQLPRVSIHMGTVAVECAAPTIGEAVQASEYLLQKIRRVLHHGGFDYG